MALVDRVNQRAIRRADPVTIEEFADILAAQNGSMSKSGVMVGARRALGLTAWWSGVRYLAEGVGFLPVHTFRDRLGHRTRRANPSWMARPDLETPWESLAEFWMMSLLHRGNAFSVKLRNPAGQVTGLRMLHPDRVKVGVADDGLKVFTVDRDYLRPYTSRQIFHIPGLSYDGVCGLDLVSVHADTLGRQAAADETASKHFKDGFHLSAYMRTEQSLTPEEANRLADRAKQLWSGLQSSHDLGIIGNGAELKTLELNPEQMQLLETRKYGDIETAQILRIPPHKLYNLDRATFSNIEHQSIEAVTDGLQPWCERIEAWVNFDRDLTVPDTFIEFQLEGKLRGDTKTRYESYSMAINAGWMSRAEPRRLENLPEEEGLDEFLIPLNMATAAQHAAVVGEAEVSE